MPADVEGHGVAPQKILQQEQDLQPRPEVATITGCTPARSGRGLRYTGRADEQQCIQESLRQHQVLRAENSQRKWVIRRLERTVKRLKDQRVDSLVNMITALNVGAIKSELREGIPHRADHLSEASLKHLINIVSSGMSGMLVRVWNMPNQTNHSRVQNAALLRYSVRSILPSKDIHVTYWQSLPVCSHLDNAPAWSRHWPS